MPRLIALNFQVGIRLRIQTRNYTISAVMPGSPEITLLADGTTQPIAITRGELATLLVKEEAEFINDIDEPPSAIRSPSRSVTDISRLSVPRILDWHAKMFLLNRLRRTPYSPKSPIFQSVFKNAQSELDKFYSFTDGFMQVKSWSAWTLYHDLLRWRSQGFELTAFQKKGVEYCPHTGARREAFELVKTEILALAKQHPHLGPTAIALVHAKARVKPPGAGQ